MPETKPTVGIMLYCPAGGHKDAFLEPKYQGLAERFIRCGTDVQTIPYNDAQADSLFEKLTKLDALLVWVNPIEQGQDRTVLDKLLDDFSATGVFVSAVPETIMKIGTKRVLFDTRDLEFGSDVELYATFDEFRNNFSSTLASDQPRVLKQFRGNGGDGVFKVRLVDNGARFAVLHAKRGSEERRLDAQDFYDDFHPYFEAGGPILNQQWNDNLANGIVRSYMTADRVVGFGYQEVNALFPKADGPVTPGRRYYFTENCALFADLRERMENDWIKVLTRKVELAPELLPMIWDADFFINSMTPNVSRRYTLCEINVSSVSPFPESAIPAIVDEVNRTISRRAIS